MIRNSVDPLHLPFSRFTVRHSRSITLRPDGHCLSRRFLLRRSASGLSPRMVRRGGPLPLRRWQTQFLDRFPRGLDGGHTRFRWRRDLTPIQLPSPIFDGDISIPPFAHHYLAMSRCVMPALSLELEKPVVIPHHPIVVDRTRAFQSENPIQCGHPRCSPVIILRLGWRPCKPAIVFRQIFVLQEHVHLLVTRDFFSP